LANGTWTPALASYGITAYNVITSSINISVSGNISSATVNKTTWETNASVVATNTYYFNYNSNAWYLDSNAVDLATYGIVITGTPQQDDIITVEYIAATPNSTITINYTKAS